MTRKTRITTICLAAAIAATGLKSNQAENSAPNSGAAYFAGCA